MPPHLSHAKPGEGIAASSAEKSTRLACSHCQGHLVADLYIDRVDAGGHVWIRALRCVRCGNIEETGRAGYRLAENGRTPGSRQAGIRTEGIG